MRKRVAMVLLWALCSCGGGSAPEQTANVNATVDWAARSRNLSAPSSALSAAFTLIGAKPGGGDFSFTINRDSNPAAYTKSYSSHNQARVGTWPLQVRFFSSRDGLGDLVGYIDAVVSVHADGSGIGNFTTTGIITKVVVDPSQVVGLGQTVDLSVTALDAVDRFVAIMPGSAFLQVVGGSNVLRVTAQHQVQGLSIGIAQVVATVDGIRSSPQDVTVAYVPVVTVTPSLASTLVNGTVQFSAVISSTPESALVWSIQEGAAGGTIDQNGTYIAPNVAGVYHVIATSHYDTSRIGVATVTVAGSAPTTGIFVVDADRIVRMDDMTGNGLTALGIHGSGVRQFNQPSIFVTAQGAIYVADFYNDRIVRMDDMTGRGWTALGSTGSGAGQFNHPSGIAVGSDGKIYVSDYENGRIVRVDNISGSGWVSYGSPGGVTIGNFYGPASVAVDSQNRIYVADSNNSRVVRFDDMTGTNWVERYLYAPVKVVTDPTGGFFALPYYTGTAYHFTDINSPFFDVRSQIGGGSNLGQVNGVFQAADGKIYLTSNLSNAPGIARIDGLSGTNYIQFPNQAATGSPFSNPRDIFVR